MSTPILEPDCYSGYPRKQVTPFINWVRSGPSARRAAMEALLLLLWPRRFKIIGFGGCTIFQTPKFEGSNINKTFDNNIIKGDNE